jgi:hypothetical protein
MYNLQDCANTANYTTVKGEGMNLAQKDTKSSVFFRR